MQPAHVLASVSWLVLLSVALVAGASWLRAPGIGYVVACALATGASALAAMRLGGSGRRSALTASAAAAVFTIVALMAQRDIARITTDWAGYRASAIERGTASMSEVLSREYQALRRLATTALDAPDARTSPVRAFDYLGAMSGEGRGIALIEGGAPVAWGGQSLMPPEQHVGSAGVSFSSFYSVLYAAAERDGRRAVATRVIWAGAPADRLVPALQERIARRVGLSELRFDPPLAVVADAGAAVFSADGIPVVGISAQAPAREEALLRATEGARSIGIVALAAAFLLLLMAAWRLPASLPVRLVPLGTALAMLALLPLSAFSRATLLFDPTVYFAEFGGAFTANVGALMLVAAIMLLAVLLVMREPLRVATRVQVIVLAGAIVAGGPFLLRLLSRGVTPPPGGITAGLWLAWETALFLAAATLLLIVSAASPAIRRSAGGLHPAVAPILAAIAAIAGPMAMEPTGGWPGWYSVLWILAIGALAITRRHRGVIVVTALVASLGAATVTWNAGVRGRMALAERDIESLNTVEAFLEPVLERFAELLAELPPPRVDADLLGAYVLSDLEGTGFPVQLTSWSPENVPLADLPLAPLVVPSGELDRLVSMTRAEGRRLVLPLAETRGAHVALGVPYPDGTVMTVMVGPRTRLIPDAPYNALLGLEPRERGQAPYTLALVPELPAADAPTEGVRWYRSDGELHGVSVLYTGAGPVRAHAEVELRSLAELIQRGTLVVLLNLALLLAIWVISTLPGGGLWTLVRRRVRGWRQSYRARLTVALFGFFVIPAAVFALWSYQRLQEEDRRARELLVRETLRALAAGEQIPDLEALGAPREAPLWLYRDGQLWRTSLPLLSALAPTGRFLPPEVHLRVVEARELFTSRILDVAGSPMLFGYRAALDPGGIPVVLSVPSRGDEAALEQRRRDLGILVLFATVIGAFAALWLSGFAARSLAEPIGSLRGAALAIAGGEREPPLAGEPPLEFQPVFSAFRRMAADLGASRAALEAAQRRTAAVLRNVASGVVAVREDASVVLANPRAESLMDVQLPSGTPLPSLGGENLGQRVRQFLSDGAPEEEEFDATDGERQIHVRLTRLPTSGGAVVTLDDVTELARAQRVLAWGEMARQVAHEIKNPLTPIRLGVQHLKRAHGDARPDFEQILDQNVSRILAEIDRLDEIARSFSRYGALPAERLRPEPIDVSAVARDVVALERMGTGAVEWQLEGGDERLMALGRSDELREVLLNLLENARLADSRRVIMRLRSAGEYVRIEVQDDGRGIPAQILPRIFEPHFSTRTSGSGLGLAVSRQLVESWGGSIVITSNGGTLVRVELVAAG